MARQPQLTPEEKQQQLLDEINAKLKEGHALLRDLQTEMKSARGLIQDLIAGVIAEELASQLKVMGDWIGEAQDRAVRKVDESFQKMADAYMGKEKDDPRPSIGELFIAHKVIDYIVDNVRKDGGYPDDYRVGIDAIPEAFLHRDKDIPGLTMSMSRPRPPLFVANPVPPDKKDTA